MQSQQKRVKWSRGETAEALEERTDTGITQASVELMENCIPDIYGNISRRPALKPIPLSAGFRSSRVSEPNAYFPFKEKVLTLDRYDLDMKLNYFDKYVQFIPFYITENDIILIGINTHESECCYLRIKDGEIVYEYDGEPISNALIRSSGVPYNLSRVSYAQQNNYMVVATTFRVYKVSFEFVNNSNAFTPIVENFEYSGGWYAPNGTQTKQVNTSVIPGLAISGHFYNYVYTDISGTTSMYSNTSTGVSGQANKELLEQEIPVGSIVKMPKIGCYFRVEGYYTEADNLYFPSITFSALQVHNDHHVAPGVSGSVCVAVNNNPNNGAYLEYWANNVLQQEIIVPTQTPIYVKSTVSSTGYSTNMTHKDGLTQDWGTWQNADMTDQTVRMFGALLAPVVDENESDDTVAVEYGYESLTPADYNVAPDPSNPLFPHPNQLCFCEQRLWAGGWAFDAEQEYALVIGSQIARYNDFKNDFNQENEPIELDILTQYKEKVVHLLDYNGLKIFTDSFEYAYSGGGVVKQSGNGSLSFCTPIVFESLCLYADSTGNQIRAMQYEFQSNIFNSSCINQVAPHDLIWYPMYMATYEDKVYSTGKHLFIVNEQVGENDVLYPSPDVYDFPKVVKVNGSSILAVCNFVPSNQANIWSRWIFPQINYTIKASDITPLPVNSNMLHSVINTKNKPIFMFKCASITTSGGLTDGMSFVPCYLDFEENLDLVGSVNSYNKFIITSSAWNGGYKYQTLTNTEVAIYSDGVFQFTTTTDNFGTITADLSGLTNITVGLPINSKIVSHPIDVGGKTKSVKKRIGKVQMSVHDTDTGAISINGKTGYMNPQQDHICFYGVSGMKDEVKYTITNKNGAMFHLESLLMNIEYGTLDS